MNKQKPPQYEVLTRVIDRVPKKTSPTGAKFGDYASVRAMVEEAGSIVIGFDTEFTDRPAFVGRPGVQSRTIDSYQAAAIDSSDPTKIRLVTILPLYDRPDEALPNMRISFELFLELVIEALDLHEHPLAPADWTAKGVSWKHATDADGNKRAADLFRSNKKAGVVSRALPITLLAHFQHADLTTFADHRLLRKVAPGIVDKDGKGVYRKGGDPHTSVRAGYAGRQSVWLDRSIPDILRTVISASGGMVSPKPVRLVLGGASWRFCRPVELSVRDTLPHAPPNLRKLADLGLAVGHPKLDVPDGWIERMSDYRREHREEFLEYGSNDAVIALEYVSAMYGDHRAIPLTLPTAAARSVRESIKTAEEMTTTRAFNLEFGGLVSATDATANIVGVEDQLDYYRQKDLVPVDGAAATWQHACANAFRGGFNSCSEVGYFGRLTNDLDLISCYPTSESALFDVDFTHPDGVIVETVNNVPLTLAHIPDPRTPFVGFVRFRHPEQVAYPAIPVQVDSSMVYPRSSGEGRGVWVSGPEIWLALTLGAEAWCQIGHFGRVRRDEHGRPSRMLRGANRQLVQDRARAKRDFGSDSLEQGTLKIMANSSYGKLAQGVMGQRGWDAWAQQRDAIGGSAITSPYHAMMTTGLVRATLLAVLNQLADLGYSTPSCTTDGFITDADLGVVDGLDLYGLSDIWREARASLTGSREMWERKHHQTDLLNITTRANFSRQSTGVLAHGGYKLPAGIVEDSQQDRDLMYRLVAGRETAIPCSHRAFPSMQELTRIDKRWDFGGAIVEKQLQMEYDRKRRPVPDGMTVDDVDVDGEVFQVAHVHTVPWDTPEQAVAGRSVDAGLKVWDDELGEEVWTRCPVRRTEAQWMDYFERLDELLDQDGSISHAEQLDRIAKSIVIAQRQGLIDIRGCATSPATARLPGVCRS
ncbi:DNA-directed DNA polymerase [Janibacter terrae]|uniref:DNA-directed DNA polymerase n=1 Tax=Janibacter terrae TaxID=103817 RepID=UPI0031F90640